MATTLPDILQAPNMLGVVQAVKAGLPTKHLPPKLLGGAGITKAVTGDTFTRYKVSGSQKTARQAAYGAPSRGRTMTGISAGSGKTIYSSENVDMKAADVINLLSADNLQRQNMGEAEWSRMIAESVTLRQNHRVAAITSAFSLGHIYYDADGNLLPSSSNAVIDINYSIPSANVITAGASWATATTDIIGDLITLQQLALKTSGYPIAHALYGSSVLKYLMTNTNCRDLIVRNVALNNGIINDAVGGLVFSLGGITWWPGYLGFFEDDNGTDQTQITGDNIVFMPEPSPDWYGLIEGTSPVASSAAGGDPMAALKSITEQQGMFQYATIQTDPVGVKMVYGDNFFPDIKAPGAVFRFDTTT